MSISRLLRESAAKYPEKTVCYFEDKTISYQMLDQNVSKVSAYLQKAGLSFQDRAAVLLPNRPEFIESYFAILRCGGIAVTINPLFKGEEVKYILNDSQVSMIITNQAYLPMIESIWKYVPSLEKAVVVGGESNGDTIAYEDIISSMEPVDCDVEVELDSVAACLYTSGTTGRPKGALLTHDNLIFDAYSVIEHIQVKDDENYSCVLPLFHSFGQTVCMLVPIFSGASITLIEQFRPDTVLKEIADKKVTIFAGVPAMYGAFLSVIKKIKSYDLSSLKLCFSGGAPMPMELMKAFEEEYSVVIIEGNGPTETSPVSYCNPRYGLRKPGSVGIPIPGVFVKIVDDNDNQVPRGEVGEICVQGRNVMKGYLNQPEATAEALKGGWFHTGDLGRMDEDGYIYIVDRKKDMIIVGGLNVYPREVEEIIYQHPKVADAAVIGKQDHLRGEVAKAYVVLKEGESVEPREIILHCKEKLANYKVPKEVVIVEALPRTSTGKVDKKVLREAETLGYL
ncbi:MAG: long-chain-fatty-acid--CoA ligase [Bacillota bacterium]|jgi:long-chain acyl-CoA synthetase